VCVWSGWTVIQHMSVLFSRVKRRDGIQLKLIYEVMMHVYKKKKTCPNKYDPFLVRTEKYSILSVL